MSAFDPSAAIVVHSLATLDAAVLSTLKAEDYLLIHRCTRSASRSTARYVDTQSRCFLRVDGDPVLRYQVSASVLQATGLADYHPGRKLSARALEFINGADMPFQFDDGPAVFIYEAPTLDPGPGDLPTIEFGIAVEFSDLDTTTYPATTTDNGPYTSQAVAAQLYTDLPAQTNATITTAGLTALLQMIFQGVDVFGTTIPTVALYDGNPSTTGTLAFEAVNMFPSWTDLLNETVSGQPTRARNHAQIHWPDTLVGAQSVTHLGFYRNGILVCSKALAATLTVPAFYGVRAPIAGLALQLTYPWGGAAPQRPSGFAMRHLLGDTSTGITTVATELTIRCYNGDPNAAGTLNETFTVPRNAATWEITAAALLQVSNKVALISDTAAPFGGWTTTYVTIELAGVATLFKTDFLSGNIVTAEGFFITIPIGALVQTIS